MFAKKLIQKATKHHQQQNLKGCLTPDDLDFRIAVHYGIPSTASILAFDPIQRVLAIGTLDGRIKVIGGDNIEGLLIAPKQIPFKYLEFLSNKGFLVSISNDNDIQVWNLENRSVASSMQWSSTITSFSVIYGSFFMYVGDDNGLMSVLKHEEDGELLLLPYHLSAKSLTEAAESSFPDRQTVVGVLHQPCSSGNRVLIAYESGLIILWDIFEAQVVVVRGDKVLELKDGVVDSSGQPEHDLEEKEITALCWASSNGTVVAVGYIDGDIMIWKTSTTGSSKKQKTASSNNNVVRLQLSSAKRKLPVIVLHWSANTKSQNDGDGQLFVYGGDEIGSEEVLTVLSLEWSPGMETLRCVGRAEITLIGSFADMSLLPSAINNHGADLLVLTSPGHLQIVNHKNLSALTTEHEKRITLSSLDCPVVVPTLNPVLSAAKLISLVGSENTSKFLLEIATNMKVNATQKLAEGSWPISGGIVHQFTSPDGYVIERIYVAGYMDGSVRIWDATSPVLSVLCVIGAMKDVEVSGSTSPVSELNLCSSTSHLAVGSQLGLIRVYNLNSSPNETDLHIVTGIKQEVHKQPQGGGPACIASFHLLDSPVQSLQYIDHGAKLAAAHECGRVAVLDMNSFSVSFLTESLPNLSSPVISMAWKSFLYNGGSVKSPKDADPKSLDKNLEKLMFVSTKDAKLYVFDGNNRMINSKPTQLKKNTTAISMHIIEGSTSSVEQKESTQLTKDVAAGSEPTSEIDQHKTEHINSGHNANAMDSLILLCCNDALCLYRLKSVVQGNEKPLLKVKLEKHCCWTSTFRKDEKSCGLVLLYQTGELEIRSLPDLELVKVTSLMSILRWSYKANMQRTMCAAKNGQIAMINGSEVALLSLLKSDDDLRVTESFPSLHDKVLAAAVEAVISSSHNQKKKQGIPRALVNILKGFKGGKPNNNVNVSEDFKYGFSNLDGIFSKNPFPDPVESNINNQEDVELDIDDIEIDEPVSISPVSISIPTSSNTKQKEETGKRSDREMLLDGDNDEPRVRTREEIIAKYRKNAGDASSVAAQARNKLLERQEKLERISKRTQDLNNEAEDFASLANELVKAMERRKWWQI
ncbi:putative transcription factor WD40-like family [Helianthus debilis subsp. tardiflorus]